MVYLGGYGKKMLNLSDFTAREYPDEEEAPYCPEYEEECVVTLYRWLCYLCREMFSPIKSDGYSWPSTLIMERLQEFKKRLQEEEIIK
jgi:hypothetical protein